MGLNVIMVVKDKDGNKINCIFFEFLNKVKFIY